MKMKMYCIYDMVSCESAPPMIAKNDAQALRMLDRSLEGLPDKGDFGLYYIGGFDTESMGLTDIATPRKVVVRDVEED